MSNLLKQAIADAKAVRATALANAKAALEEAFAPKLQSMLATKLQQEVEDASTDEAPEEQPQVDDVSVTDEVPVADAPIESPTDEAPVGDDVGTDIAPTDDAAATTPTAPAEEAPIPDEGTETEEEGMGEMEEELLGQGNPDPVSMTTNLTETEKASSDYKKVASGSHKTDDPGKQMVKKAVDMKTKGGPKSAPAERTANSNYKTGDTGKRPGTIKNIKASGTEDPQGPSDELNCGPKKDAKKNTDKTLEENENVELDDQNLDEILKELESEVAASNCEDGDTHNVAPDEGNATNESSMEDEEINLQELFGKDEDEEDDKDEDEEKKDKKPDFLKENNSLKKELQEYRETVQYLRTQINEVNLLNAKLLYTNKLFKQASLTNEQKLKVIESFDLTKSVREAKLVFATLTESFIFGGKKTVQAPTPTQTSKKVAIVRTITEGLASKAIASTKSTKAEVIIEGAEMAARFKKLANIRSK